MSPDTARLKRQRLSDGSAVTSAVPRSSYVTTGRDTPVADLESPRMLYSLQALDSDAHNVRLQIAADEQADKQTGSSYARHLRNYVTWFSEDQARVTAGDPTRVPIPAFPITPAKVVMFLNYETTREKRKRGSKTETIVSSTVGKSQVAQVISALENHRLLNQHLYKSDHDANTKLRDDVRIRTIESAAKHNEPKRVESAQKLKAAGSSADTYTKAELSRCSLWCLTNFSGTHHIVIGLRDRAMLLMSTATAFRGESCRMLQWSDLFMIQAPLDALMGKEVTVFGALADNAKHNQNGRVDEHGVLRHREVELCPVGAIALYLFSYWHILDLPVPNFEPDFSRPGYGEYGYREWYNHYLFWSKSVLQQMSYETHRDRFNLMHKKNDIFISKSTHGARHFAARSARAHGGSSDGVKALGGWNEQNGSFTPVYDRNFPIDALLGAAMFNGRRPEQYHLPRDSLEPPTELLASIFPWVETEQAKLLARQQQGRIHQDTALVSFLNVLLWLRLVILQDAAVLYSKYPSLSFFQFAPFNTAAFRTFAFTSAAAVGRAEEAARVQLQNLPETCIATMQGLVTSVSLEQEKQRAENEAHWADVKAHMQRMEDMFEATVPKRPRRSKAKTAVCQPPSLPVSVDQPLSPTYSLPMHPPPAPPLSSVPCITVNITSPQLPGGMVTASAVIAPASIDLNSGGPSPGAPATRSPLPVSAPLNSLVSPTADAQHSHWTTLVSKFGDSKLRCHQWEWKDGRWIPYYQFQKLSGIPDIWTEWASGLNGHLSVRELREEWGAKWMRTRSLTTEFGRRHRVVRLITTLCNKPRWTIDLTHRYLAERYRGFTARAVCDHLVKGNYEAAVIAADNFP